jgi:hypothetical protein
MSKEEPVLIEEMEEKLDWQMHVNYYLN